MLQGFVMNVQPSKVEAGFDIRVPPTADIESLERRIADEWAPASRNMTFQVINFRLLLYSPMRRLYLSLNTCKKWTIALLVSFLA